MNELDCAWAAGFFDGDGHIGVTRQKKHGREVRWVRMAVGQSDVRPLERLRSIFGGKIIPVGPNALSVKPRWMWYLSRRADIEAAMAAMVPYLSAPKLEQWADVQGNCPILRPGRVFAETR
jgi:hypothetical protein